MGLGLLLSLLSNCGPGYEDFDKNIPLPEPPHSVPDESLGIVDPGLDLRRRLEELGAPRRAVDHAIGHHEQTAHELENPTWLSIIDFTVHSTEKRWFLVNMDTLEIWTLLAAHGENSDPDNDGYATEFSNRVGSHQSSLGLYTTAERYYGGNGLSMRLDGLEATNDQARRRYIVVHGSDYVSPDRNPLGRSWGCPAVEMHWIQPLVGKIEEGSLLYIHHEDFFEGQGARNLLQAKGSL